MIISAIRKNEIAAVFVDTAKNLSMVVLKSGEKLIFPADRFSTDCDLFCEQITLVMGTSEDIVFLPDEIPSEIKQEQSSNLVW